MHAPSPAMARAYRATAYRVFLPFGEIVLRCGRKARRLDDWLEAEGLAHWCVLTAWNPGSRRLAAAENRRRQEALRQHLLARVYRLFPGENHADAKNWPIEETFFVPMLAQAAARELTRSYGQNAFLWGARGKAARLCWRIKDRR
jgi:hypothetical protein